MLQDAIERVKGVGEKTATLFHKEGIFTKEDLILGFPISYREYPAPVLIQQARDKEWMAFSGVLKEDFRGNSGMRRVFSSPKFSIRAERLFYSTFMLLIFVKF